MGMITVEEALSRCLSTDLPRRTEILPLSEADGRLLAEDLYAPSPLPRWDNSAMDGFAIRYADCTPHSGTPAQPGCELSTPSEPPPATAHLRTIGTIAAGDMPDTAVTPGTTLRIMTGAPLPAGADTVVMRENVTDADGVAIIHGMPRRGQHIRRAGEEVALGQLAVPAGTALTPPVIGLCASMGLSDVTVAARPRVALLGTGDELVPPGQPLEPGQIYSSNSLALAAMVRQAGGEPVDCGIAPDTLEGTRAAFQRALDTGCDLILSTGGVSVGDFDVVKEALTDVGAEMVFWKVRVKPGKPLAMGMIGDRPAFGLPGNPVSCMVNFLQFVRPLIRRAVGDPRPFLPAVPATLRGSLRKRHGRAELVRVVLSWSESGLIAETTGGQSSGWISSMARADGLLLLGIDSEGAADGDAVVVQIIRPGFLSSETPQYPW
ncbi:MAG: molybdopterin molybdotransferase MoeA [Myxococcota bacterium]|nr:molybdopterin molybdotransferase MoeA [Myxococcota bacterium]